VQKVKRKLCPVVYKWTMLRVSESAEPPPSYSSLFQRVKAAKTESTSKAGFVKSLPAIFVGTGMLTASRYCFSLFYSFTKYATCQDVFGNRLKLLLTDLSPNFIAYILLKPISDQVLAEKSETRSATLKTCRTPGLQTLFLLKDRDPV